MIYKDLEKTIEDPRKIEFEELLAETYMHWDSFNLNAAHHKMHQVFDKARQYNIKFDSRIRENHEALELINPKEEDNKSDLYYLHIIVDLYTNALNKAKAGAFGAGINRLYRAIELIAQYKLRSHGIENTAEVKLNDEITQKYKIVTKEIYEKEKSPPEEVGLKDAFILLYIFQDPLTKDYEIKNLQDMFGIIRARDMSIVAHGLAQVGDKAFNNMANLAKGFIQKICDEQNQNFAYLIQQHTFYDLK